MRRSALYIICLLCLAFLQFSCKDDAYTYPPVQLEFVSMHTTASGTVDYFLNDDDKAYHVDNPSRIANLRPDTIYRMVCNYEVTGIPSATTKGSAFIYTSLQPVSVNPVAVGAIVGEVKTDPLEVQSIWKKNPDYINMVLLVKNQGGKHLFHFVEQGITTEAGRKKLTLLLFHDKRNDVEAYTERAYLSVPLLKYKNILKDGDVIDFQINTRSEGIKTYSFTY